MVYRWIQDPVGYGAGMSGVKYAEAMGKLPEHIPGGNTHKLYMLTN